MAGYKEPGFQDRVAAAAKAREAALQKLKSKQPIDPAVAAERAEKARLKEEALAAKAAARKAEKIAQREAAEAAARAEAERIEAEKPDPEALEAERKAARDARYAARKAHKGR